MNKPDKIIIHHSLTEDGKVVDWNSIRNYHINTKGWRDIGYHYGIELVGDKYVIQKGRKENEDGAHTLNQNTKSIGICLIGNFDKVEPPLAQLEKLAELIKDIFSRYGRLPIYGHSDFASYKSCPGTKFDWDTLYELLEEKKSNTFENARQWVMHNKISDGNRPKDPVTREELWTILYRMEVLKK